tara:strand:+ start:5571 stop:5810 length:240 start_codon:yes stop_codon:yes gene_type:complete
LQRQAAKQSDKAQKTIDEFIQLDDKLHYIWVIFVELFNATGGEITYSEMKAYSEFHAVLKPFEIKAIMTINNEKKNANG